MQLFDEGRHGCFGQIMLSNGHEQRLNLLIGVSNSTHVLSICLCLSMCLFVYVFVVLYISLCIYLFICLIVCVHMPLSMTLSVCI